MKLYRFFVLLVLSVMFFAIVGCNSPVIYTPDDEAKYIKPTIAVTKFNNRAPVNTKWNLGEGIADILSDKLMKTRRFTVLERQELEAIMTELSHSSDSRFNKKQSPALGRLKHVRYLIRGSITDFGHVENVEGLARLIDWGWFGSSSYSLVAAVIQVVDVQTGQVVASRSVEARVKDSKDKGKVSVDGMSFGSLTFYHTSIGKATSKMIDRAVRAIADAIADEPFQPKIASIIDGQIIINAGKNRRIKVGQQFIVRPEPIPVRDPDTDDLLSFVAASPIGTVEITQVMKKISLAKVIDGSGFQRGQTLFSYQAEIGTTPAPVVQSH